MQVLSHDGWSFAKMTAALPDLPPWFDDESDDEEEVACDDVDMAYDE